MDVGSAFPADPQPAEAMPPGEDPLDHPTMPAQSMEGLDALVGEAVLVVVALASVEFAGPSTSAAATRADRWDARDQRGEDARSSWNRYRQVLRIQLHVDTCRTTYMSMDSTESCLTGSSACRSFPLSAT